MVLARRFRIVRLIGRGGMGEVYEAEDLELREPVALKTIRPEIATNARALELFKKEIQTARRVTHPNVCRIYDLAQHTEPRLDGVEQITTFLTMELLEGQTLAEHLKEHGPFRPDNALPLIGQMAAAIEAAHSAGVIHRDFKPGNVMLVPGQDGFRPVVTDFGLAVAQARGETGAEAENAGGTPAYMAPEQSRGGPMTAAADIYALALVIADMIGARPKASIAGAADISLPRRWAGWKRVLLRCLDADPARRYSRPLAVFEMLQAGAKPARKVTRRLLTLTGAVALTLGAWSMQRQSPPQVHPQSQTYRKIGPNEGFLRPSPDGRFLAMTDWNTGNLALREIATGRTRALTRKGPNWATGAQAEGAIFSPDGQRIAYTWMNDKDQSELRTIGVDGTGDRLLYAHPELQQCELMDWSRDGRTLLAQFMWTGFKYQAVTVSTQSGAISAVTRAGDSPYGTAVFSPEGRSIIFDAIQPGDEPVSDIYIKPLAGGVAAPIVEHPANDTLVGLAPDHRRIIFKSDRRGSNGLWAVAVSEREAVGQPVELARDLGRFSPLGLTHDGSLFTTVDSGAFEVYAAELDLAAGRVVSGPQRVMTRFVGGSRFPSWSADGRRLAFMSSIEPRMPALGIYSRDTGKIKTTFVKLGFFVRPQWHPGGKWIVAPGADRNGQTGQFRIDPETGDAALLVSAAALGGGSEGAWTRDGKTVFYRFGDPKLGIFRYDIKTGRRQMLYVPPADVNIGRENLTLSPDERTLAFHAGHLRGSSLMLMPAAGGTARPLLTIQEPEQFPFWAFAWTPDSRQVLTVRSRGNASELWLVPADGGAPSKIEFPKMDMKQLRLNRDGRTIAFTSGNGASEIWLAENFLSEK
jgi:serine/threonine protein kinase